MQLDHVVIRVRSLEVSLPWYAALLGLLGFAKTRDHVWYDGTPAFDIQAAEPGTGDYQRFGPGVNHVGFTAPEPQLDDVRKGMADAGFDVPDKQQFGEDVATFFKDPDGLRLEVTAYS